MMISEDVEDSFLAEGLRRYAVALSTLNAFEAMLKERLEEVTKAYTWNGFKPTKEPVTTGLTKSGGARWIWATQARTLDSRRGRVYLELGMVWKDAEVAHYANLLDADYNVIDFSYDRNHPRIEPKKWSRNMRLFMLASENAGQNLDAEFKILLDELLSTFASPT